jgi:hypothetical protein
MTQRTILELVQDIGRSIGSDEIDSLDETTESDDILNFLIMAFDEVIQRRDWEFARNRVRVLDAREAGDTQINRLKIPTDIMQLSELVLRYRSPTDSRDEVFKELVYLAPYDFLEHVQQLNENDSNVDTILNTDGVSMLIRNDADPTYYTSFDEQYIWFDAYDSSRGTGNIAGDAIILGTILPTVDWTNEAAFLPVPERVERLILEEAIQLCSVRLRQVPDPIAARNANRQFNRLRESEARVNKDRNEIDYSRRWR